MIREHLRSGVVIPAHPLALTARRTLDERRQRALTRYYVDAGAGGVAVGVHTTQFTIRSTEFGLYRPVLELAADTIREWITDGRPFVKVAGVCGHTAQARTEAEIAAALGYDVALLSLGEWRDEPEAELIDHCRIIAEVMPICGFYLQPSVGGRHLSHAFWRELAELPNLWAIKIAPFDRYRTIDVVRAVIEAERDDVALYTGNDDNILADLLTPFTGSVGGRTVTRWIDGGLLGQWAVWTERAVSLLRDAQEARAAAVAASRVERADARVEAAAMIDVEWLRRNAALTDANAALFDPSHGFAGCIPGIHEALRRAGLLEGTWCLDPRETLSPGQMEEIDRVWRAYPELRDDAFVAANLARWLA